MSDSQIIYNFLELNIPNEHPAIYQFVIGRTRSQESAVNRLVNDCDVILIPPYSAGHVRSVIRKFLKDKKHLHSLGKIKIKPIY